MLFRFFSITATTALLLLLVGCATDLKPYRPQKRLGQGSAVQLLQDEVQSHGIGGSETAPAGTYTPAFENDDYVFYRGPGIVEKGGWAKTVVEGGLAISKRRLGYVILYTLGPGGAANLSNRPVRAPMIIKP